MLIKLLFFHQFIIRIQSAMNRSQLRSIKSNPCVISFIISKWQRYMASKLSSQTQYCEIVTQHLICFCNKLCNSNLDKLSERISEYAVDSSKDTAKRIELTMSELYDINCCEGLFYKYEY